MDAATADQEVAPYLWEQVSGSVTSPVELEQIRKAVGFDIVDASTDIYEECRALLEIHGEYATETNELDAGGLPRATSSTPAGLVRLELESLIKTLREQAAAAGMDENALMPKKK